VRSRVHGARERDARLLPAGQCEPALADLGRVARAQCAQIARERASMHDCRVARGVVRRAEQDVRAHGIVDHPGLLRSVRDAPRAWQAHPAAAAGRAAHLSEQRKQQRRLARAGWADD
jgi:hypothetical protein